MSTELETLISEISECESLENICMLAAKFKGTSLESNVFKYIKTGLKSFLENNANPQTIEKVFQKTRPFNTLLPFVILDLVCSFLKSTERCKYAIVCQDFAKINCKYVSIENFHEIRIIQSAKIENKNENNNDDNHNEIKEYKYDIERWVYTHPLINAKINIQTAKRLFKYIPKLEIDFYEKVFSVFFFFFFPNSRVCELICEFA